MLWIIICDNMFIGDKMLVNMIDLLNEAKVAESNARYSVISSVYNLEWVIQEKLPVHDVNQYTPVESPLR